MSTGTIITISIVSLALIYFGSRLQMKGWIDEFNRHFEGKYKHLIKTKTDEEGKKI